MNLGTTERDESLEEVAEILPSDCDHSKCPIERSAEASVSPSIAHDLIAPVESKRRRVMNPEDYLEQEADVPADDLEEFESRMEANGIAKGSEVWRMLWTEHAEDRLRAQDPAAHAEYCRRKYGVGQEDDEDPAPEADGAAVPDDALPEDMDEEGFIDLENGEEEARVMRMTKPTVLPSQEAVRQHNLSHCNYRPWCPICVAGAANDDRHMPRAKDPNDAPEVGSDYAFLRNKRGDKVYRPMLVSKYRGVGCFAAHMVPKKGVGGGWVVQQYLRDLRRWGLRHKVILRSDGEPAIVDLLSRVSDLRQAETLLEASPATDSRANGLAERAIQSVEKQVRVLKLALERNMKEKIGVEHPCFPWLVEHAADILTKFVVGRDGMTGWERLKGRKYGGLLFEFGTKVLHRVQQKPVGGEMGARWLPAVWLGERFATDEHVVAMEDGTVVRTGAVREFPGDVFDKELLDKIIGMPWDPRGSGHEQGGADREQPRAGDVSQAPVVEPTPMAEPNVRRLVITHEIIKKVGYTDECLKCSQLRRGEKSDKAHSEECRTRVENLMRDHPELSAKLREAEERQDAYCARRVEAEDARRDPAPAPANPEPPLAEAHIAARPVRPRVDSGVEPERPHKKSRGEEAEEAIGEMPIPQAGQTDDEEKPTPKRTRFEDEPDSDPEEPAPPDDPDLVASLQKKKRRKRGARGASGLSDKPEGKYDVCEAFSPPRVAARARERGLRGGWSLDIIGDDDVTQRRWDLSCPKHAEEAFRLVARDKPRLVVLSPPCTKFSSLWFLMKKAMPREEWLHAVRMVNVAVKIAEIQLDGGRHFVFEHPLTASSWKLPSLKRLRARAGVHETSLHMCAFGLTSQDACGEALAKKPTRILTSSSAICEKLSRFCSKDHRHVLLMSGRAAAAAIYTVEFVDAILDGLEIVLCAKMNAHFIGSVMHRDEDDGHVDSDQAVRDSVGEYFVGIDGSYVDDISGESLPPHLVQEGRRDELLGFEKRDVYEVVGRSWAEQRGIPIKGTRWVDKKKGEKIRSRLCVQDFNFKKGKLGPDELFAPTPPLVAARYTVSRAASGVRAPRRLRRKLMALDFDKAFLNGVMERQVCIVLPEEDSRRCNGAKVGLLKRAMYGLREAPAIWQRVVRQLMQELGFEACVTVPCLYYHPERDLLVVAHVDDLLVSGPHEELVSLRQAIRERFECGGDILGDEVGDVSEISFLGRRIRQTQDGLEWVGDQKLVDAFLQRAGARDSRSIGSVDTPGVKHDRDEEASLLETDAATLHRSLVALLNYISQDRPDLSFSAKELSQTMARPRVGDDRGIKRVVRYLHRFPEAAIVYKYQDEPSSLSVFTDADWGGCAKTRRSTSGGVVLRGSHLLCFWSKTQQCVALSSCESEVNALVKGGTEGLGVKIMAEQCGEEMNLLLKTDASAAQGLCARQGAGRVKHLTVRQLWAQEKEASGDLKILKVPRLTNCADMFTHHWTKAEGEKFLQHISVQRLEISNDIKPRGRVGEC